MLSSLDTSSLVFAIAIVAILSLMLGMALDGLMQDDGFGPFGNMIVITAGFFLGIFAANRWGIRFGALEIAVATGLGGAFLALLLLSLAKAGIERAMRS
ncbi:hypothetical protein [Mesorhizobium sp. J428]|uniref:hypothetical protein n=1 Tax=Mesorhizobium sp. J428 TaxID=2898440 RepID=UPI002150E6F5|nr:hypothetical protein [Mesorhizobium sp. J428]MCR5856495.1 hypothetical protein [Mesorhizobium sp. J428]